MEGVMKCPGQDMQYWTSEAIYEVTCPQCNHTVEFYKDDTSRKCGNCGHRFVNPKLDFGCAAYCQFAEQCLGTLPEEFVAQKENLLKDRVAIEMKKYCKNDFKQISHASRLARHAERIGRNEGGNPALILCSSYLQNIGRSEALRKNGAATQDSIQKESVAIAETILKKLGANEKLVKNVCDIIASSPELSGSTELDVVHDAEVIAELAEEHKTSPLDPSRLTEVLKSRLRTEGGRQEAREVFQQLG
jgi:DNA-directed RNA polymerase subunit RPC12/RpoP